MAKTTLTLINATHTDRATKAFKSVPSLRSIALLETTPTTVLPTFAHATRISSCLCSHSSGTPIISTMILTNMTTDSTGMLIATTYPEKVKLRAVVTTQQGILTTFRVNSNSAAMSILFTTRWTSAALIMVKFYRSEPVKLVR